jgi:hypothetical protein
VNERSAANVNRLKRVRELATTASRRLMSGIGNRGLSTAEVVVNLVLR